MNETVTGETNYNNIKSHEACNSTDCPDRNLFPKLLTIILHVNFLLNPLFPHAMPLKWVRLCKVEIVYTE